MNGDIIVADSSPLISLAITGKLELLSHFYSKVLMPPAVWDEVTIRGQGLPGAYEVSQITWIEIHSPNQQILDPLTVLLDRGEAEVIALALSVDRKQQKNRLSVRSSAFRRYGPRP